MPFDDGLLLIAPKDNLTRKEKIILNLYILGGFNRAVEMRYLINRIYFGEMFYGWGFFGNLYKSIYGTIWRECKGLELDGYLEKYNNPVRWKLKYNRTVAKKLVHILHKLGFENANLLDFGFVQ